MISLIRLLFILLLCVVGVGWFRGWYSLSSPQRDAEHNKVNISVSVDATKVEADAKTLKQEIVARVAQHAQDADTKAAPAQSAPVQYAPTQAAPAQYAPAPAQYAPAPAQYAPAPAQYVPAPAAPAIRSVPTFDIGR